MKNLIFITLFAIASLYSCKSKPDAEKAKTEEAKKAAELSGSELKLAGADNYLQWIGTKPGGQHNGTVQITKGILTVSDNEITGGSFVFDKNSIISLDLKDPGMNSKLIGHLKSQDFFYVEKYPEARFEFVSAKPLAGENPVREGQVIPNKEITGNLTMRGITKSITFPAKIDILNESVEVKVNPFSINRTHWDVNFMSKSIFAELKDKFIDDEIVLSFDLKFIL